MATTIFYQASRSRGGSLPAPTLGKGGLFNLSHSADPRIISSSDSCSRGGQQGTETHSCPFRSPHTPVKACWIWLWDQLSSNPSPYELFRTICKFSFFFLASTASVYRKRDAATPWKLCLFHSFPLAKLQGDGRNTQHFQSIFCILNISHKCISPWPAHQVCEMVPAQAALDLYPQHVNRNDSFSIIQLSWSS